MQLLERAEVVAQLARAALSWIRRDTDFASPVADNPKFMSPRAAVELIRDGDVVATSGLGGNQRASIVYAAIRERFEKSGHPAGLTVVNLGGCVAQRRFPVRWRSSDKLACAAGSSPATSRPFMPCSGSPRRASANCGSAGTPGAVAGGLARGRARG
jgi:hypothetical protein